MIVTSLRLRALPLGICLIWLACESHFSPAFFAANVQYSVSEIMGRMRIAEMAPGPKPRWRTAAIGANGR